MTDLNISSFISSKVQEFLNQFDTDGNGTIEKANGEYAAMQKALNGGKAEELGNVDAILLNNTSQAKAANRATENFNWDTAVDNYNKASLKERETTRDNVTSYVKEKLNTVSENIDTKVLKALADVSTVDPERYKYYMGSLAGGIRDTLNATINGFEEQLTEIREFIRDEIRQYDPRYATSRQTVGGHYIDNEDTRLLNDMMKGFEDIQIDDELVQKLCNMNEHERDIDIKSFQLQAYTKFSERISELLRATKNIVTEMSNNQKESLDSIDEVTEEGNLTHEVGLESSLSLGPVQVDQFNISNKDPETYNKFLNEVKTYNGTTGISSVSKDDQNAPIYDINGRQVKQENLQKGQVYIQNGKKFVTQ